MRQKKITIEHESFNPVTRTQNSLTALAYDPTTSQGIIVCEHTAYSFTESDPLILKKVSAPPTLSEYQYKETSEQPTAHITLILPNKKKRFHAALFYKRLILCSVDTE